MCFFWFLLLEIFRKRGKYFVSKKSKFKSLKERFVIYKYFGLVISEW